jgi:hypothetical protein
MTRAPSLSSTLYRWKDILDLRRAPTGRRRSRAGKPTSVICNLARRPPPALRAHGIGALSASSNIRPLKQGRAAAHEGSAPARPPKPRRSRAQPFARERKPRRTRSRNHLPKETPTPNPKSAAHQQIQATEAEDLGGGRQLRSLPQPSASLQDGVAEAGRVDLRDFAMVDRRHRRRNRLHWL